VLGMDLDQITAEEVAAVVAAHPRPDFKNNILRAFYDGMKDRPHTTFGTMNDDVLAHFAPGFTRADFVDIITSSACPSDLSATGHTEENRHDERLCPGSKQGIAATRRSRLHRLARTRGEPAGRTRRPDRTVPADQADPLERRRPQLSDLHLQPGQNL
jgi:hypothetical protein